MQRPIVHRSKQTSESHTDPLVTTRSPCSLSPILCPDASGGRGVYFPEWTPVSNLAVRGAFAGTPRRATKIPGGNHARNHPGWFSIRSYRVIGIPNFVSSPGRAMQRLLFPVRFLLKAFVSRSGLLTRRTTHPSHPLFFFFPQSTAKAAEEYAGGPG